MEPLAAGVGDLGVLAVGGHFAAADNHRRAFVKRRAQEHRRVEGTGGGVEQHQLRPAGDFGVAGSHSNSKRFVAAVDVTRFAAAASRMFRQRFPYRRPLRSGRRKDVVDAGSFHDLQHCLSATHRFSFKNPMECWSTGVLGLMHHSITPPLHHSNSLCVPSAATSFSFQLRSRFPRGL